MMLHHVAKVELIAFVKAVEQLHALVLQVHAMLLNDMQQQFCIESLLVHAHDHDIAQLTATACGMSNQALMQQAEWQTLYVGPANANNLAKNHCSLIHAQ